MSRLHRTATYRASVEQIARDLAQSNATAALGVWNEIERQVERLADFPSSGRRGRVSGTRELVISRTPFIVVYRVAEADIYLLSVRHAARKWPDTFS